MDLKYRFRDGPISYQSPMMILGFYMIVISITCFFLILYCKDTLAFSGNQIGAFRAWRFAGLTIGILIAGYAIRFLAFSISRMAAGGCGNNYFLSIHMAIPLYDRPSGYKIFRKEDSNEYHSRFLQCF
jgi:hypothetical protein